LTKIEVQYLPEIELSLNKLSELLFEMEYFSFLDFSQNYIEKLTNYVEENISKLQHKITPIALKKFGSLYIFYKANNRTTWYIFFEKHENRYLITHITNNHIGDINKLNV
jgi:hypothetical protein